MKVKFTEKMTTAIVSIMLVLVMMLGSLVSCGRDPRQGNIPPADASKTAIYVGIWDGGYKSNWAERYEKDFEALYANTSFEEGKMGVDVIIVSNKDYGPNCSNSILSLPTDIMFIEQENYYSMLNAGALYDITEWLTTPLTEFDETRSIEDKMTDYDKNYFGQTSEKTTAEYRAVPWYTSFSSISYDIDLFDDYSFYFAPEGEGDADGFIIDMDSPKNVGLDGVTGTADDGLPRTYEEFFKLCDRMVDMGVTPVTWAGSVPGYMNNLFTSLVATASGYDEMQLNYTLNGTSDTIVSSINSDGSVTIGDAVTITNANGYQLRGQAGWYYALQFMEQLITTTNDSGDYKYYDYVDCFSTSMAHTSAQSNFLKSSNNNAPIGMYIDGTWWYNEASSVFKSMESIPGMSQKDRNIGLMALPVPTEKMAETATGEDSTLMNTWVTTCIVKSTIEESKIDAVRAFFRYMHTDKALSTYTMDSNGIRPFNFELTGVTKNDMSNFAYQQYTMFQSSKIVNPYSDNTIIKNYLSEIHDNYTSVAGDSQYEMVVYAFRDGVSAKEYFEGMKNYFNQKKWNGFITVLPGN